MIITENGIDYDVEGDYPDGKYVKQISNKGTPPGSEPSVIEILTTVNSRLATLEALVTNVKTSVDDVKEAIDTAEGAAAKA